MAEENRGAAAPGNENENATAQPAPPFIPQTNQQRVAIQQDEQHLLKNKQMAGEMEKVTASDGKTEINKFEEHLIHLKTTTKIHDPVKKEYKKEHRTIKLGVKQYHDMVKNRAFVAYDGTAIVHDPRTDTMKKAFEAEMAVLDKKRSQKGRRPEH